MGHYPIKCIHCMREVKMSERMVKLTRDGIMTDQDMNQGLNNIPVMGGNLRGSSLHGSDESPYKSIQTLRNDNKIIREHYLRDINVSREFLENGNHEFEEDFLQSIELKEVKLSDGETVNGTVRTFFCPYCYEEIIPLAGKMPMYLISVLGPSSAGKTVYLTILHMLLTGQEYRLPTGCLTFDNIGAMGKEFQRYALAIRRSNELPATTQENRKDPYLLKVSYKVNAGSPVTNKQCLLGLIDMRGEMLQGEHNMELHRDNVPQFKLADGFVMMVDPETLEGVYNRLPEQEFGGRKIEALTMTLSAMKETIMECITAEMGQIRKPSVVALAKQDILLKHYAELGIPLTQPVIAPQFRMIQGTNLGETYYRPMNASTQNCIRYLSGAFTSFLQDTFANPYFTSLSALGSYVRIAGNKVDNSNKIHPVRVEEPLIYLLMCLNFIPPFMLGAYYANPAATIEEWASGYAENWRGSEPQNVKNVPNDENPKKKKGLFR